MQWQQLLRQYCSTCSLNKLLQAEVAKHVDMLYVRTFSSGRFNAEVRNKNVYFRAYIFF